jgi:hypothetical protein
MRHQEIRHSAFLAFLMARASRMGWETPFCRGSFKAPWLPLPKIPRFRSSLSELAALTLSDARVDREWHNNRYPGA